MNPLNKSVEAALHALDGLRPMFEKDFSPSLVFDEIKAEARAALINNPEQVSQTIEMEGVSPRTACLMLLTKNYAAALG